MAERGTPEEQKVALEKLARLEAKYDFKREQETDIPDLFSGWSPQKSGKSESVLSVDPEWMDAGNVVKWVFKNQFQLDSKWSQSAVDAKLLLLGNLGSVTRTKSFSDRLFGTIQAACLTFFGVRPTSGMERAPFLSGIYDGIMNEIRPAGMRLPGRSGLEKKKGARQTSRRAKSKKPVEVSAIASIHPYDLGREAGQKMRLDLPREAICEGIRLAVTAPGEAGVETGKQAV